MIKYGLILGAVGIFLCVTAASPSLLPYKPVCGSDGKTYSHRALLNIEQSKNPNLGFAHPGKCSKHERRIRSVSPCPTEVREVCGSDGVTYTNFCMLNQAHDVKSEITLSHLGPCTNKTVEKQGNKTSLVNSADNAFNKPTNEKHSLKNVSELNAQHTQNQNSSSLEHMREAQNLIKPRDIETLEDTSDAGDDSSQGLNDAQNEQKTSEGVKTEKSNDADDLEDTNEEHDVEDVHLAQNLEMPVDEQDTLNVSEVNNESVANNDKTNVESNQNTSHVEIEQNTNNIVNKAVKSNSLNNQNTSHVEIEQNTNNIVNKAVKSNSLNKSEVFNVLNETESNLQVEIEVKSNQNESEANITKNKNGKQNETEAHGKPKDINKSEKSRKRRDVNNAYANDEQRHSAAKHDGKSKYEKSKKMAVTNTESEPELRTSTDKARKTRSVGKFGKSKTRRNGKTTDSNSIVVKNNFEEDKYNTHKSRKQRHVKNVSFNVKDTKHKHSNQKNKKPHKQIKKPHYYARAQKS